MSIIGGIREFIKECPYLVDYLGVTKPKVGVDYLDDEIICYSVERVPCNPIIKEYIDGSSKKQEVFIFSSREEYGPDVFVNLENINFYENFASWIREQNKKGILPMLGNKLEAEKIEVSTNGYAFQTSETKARYQIQLRLIYSERK